MLIIPSIERIQRRPPIPAPEEFVWHPQTVRSWRRDGWLWTPTFELPVYSPIQLATYLSGGNAADSSGTPGTTLDVTATLTSGSCLISWSKFEGATTTNTVAKSDGTNTFTSAGVVSHSNGDLHSTWHYLLTHAMSGSTTIRQMLGASRPYRGFIVMEFSYSGTASYDASTINVQVGTSSLTSGNVTVGGNSQIVCGGYGEYAADTASSLQINGVAADGSMVAGEGYAAMWRRVVTAGFTGAATGTLVSTSDHLCGLISINVAGGGAAAPVLWRSPMGHLLVR